MFALKLSLVAATIWLATLVTRRLGHALGGALSGMPMILAPILGVLLIDLPAAQVQAIALATLACVPATVLFIVVYGRACTRWPWPVCLLMATAVFLLAASALTQVVRSAGWVIAMAAVAPGLGLWALARPEHVGGAVPIPRSELAWRLGAAIAMAGAVMLSADALPARVSGLLLAVPIAGSILPSFTLPRHGGQATVALLRGFAMGLHGFVVFLVGLYVALGLLPAAWAFALALAASATTGWVAYRLRHRRRLAGR